MREVKILKKRKIQYIILFCVFAVTGILLCLNKYVSYDESYSLCLIRHGFSEIIRITGQDVHPPLYYLLLKIWMLPFGESIFAARLFSFLIVAILAVLGPTLVSKTLGEKAGWWYSFFVICLPACQTFLVTEIRMYALATLMTTLTALFAIRIVKNLSSHARNWFGVFLCGIMAAYVQYYALIAVAFIYVLLLVWSIRNKSWKGWAISVTFSAVLYMPWLIVLFQQFQTVSKCYWIRPIGMHESLSFIAFPTYCSIHTIASVAYLLVLALIVAFGFAQKRKGDRAILFCIVPYVGMIAVGILVSVLVRPLFSARYIKCVLGLLVLGLAIVLSQVQESKHAKNIKRGLICFCSVFWGVNATFMICELVQNEATYEQISNAQKSMQDLLILAKEQAHPLGMECFYFGDVPVYMPEESYTQELEAFAPTLRQINSLDEIRLHMSNGKKVYVLNSGNWNETEDDVIDGVGSIGDVVHQWIFHDQTDIVQMELRACE